MRGKTPLRSYREVSTITAPPGRIVLMLYDGALAFLERARIGLGLSDPAERNLAVNSNLQRAQEIIRGLDQALDMDKGGELASTLSRLYDYFDRRLHESNMSKLPDGIDEVVRHLAELRNAWDTMLHNGNPPI